MNQTNHKKKRAKGFCCLHDSGPYKKLAKARNMERKVRQEAKLTPQQKADIAYEVQQQTLWLNREICKIGACIHPNCERRNKDEDKS